MTEPDFSGWATKHNTTCSDGRTILADAFKDNDGLEVPLVYQHGHTDVDDVLGYARLENKPEGVRAHAFFNNTDKGKTAKELVRHGDIKWLSVFANNLVEKMQNGLKAVVHGNIREVSLVLAGANPGAVIDNVNIVHGDGDFEVVTEEAIISTGEQIEPAAEEAELVHADTNGTVVDSAATAEAPNELERILSTFNDEQETALNYLLVKALTKDGQVQHSDTEPDAAVDVDVDVNAVLDSEDAADAESDSEVETEGDAEAEADADTEVETEGDADAEADASADADANADEGGDATSDAENDADAETDTDTNEAGDAVQNDDTTNQEDNSMTHNLFDQAANQGGSSMTHTQHKLSKDEVQSLMRQVVDGETTLSAVLKHYAVEKGVSVGGTLQHGIENIDYLFPDFKLIESSPQFISRRMEWVDKVLNSVRKSPMSRIKTVTADITPDEARARGYITGNMKNEEFFALSKRTTSPQTIYKKQKLDRDDVLDIVDLDVIAWLKAEMKVMLDEEIASAILFGDGRSAGDDDRINPANVRPIATDSELYVTQVYVNIDDANSDMEEVVDAAIMNREFYKGSGQPTFYTTQSMISKFKLVKDGNDQRRYKTNADIAAILDVADVVAVETMARIPSLVGIMVNLTDYSIGTDRGGQATFFDDFDLNYNKLLYLLETRLSGALTTPKSALVFNKVASNLVLATPDAPAFDASTGVLTVPTVTGVTYKNDANATLTTGSPVTVAAGATYNVHAVPASGYYFGSSASDQWAFTANA